MTDQIRKLEQTLLDLGAEVFRLRHLCTNLAEQNRVFVKSMKGLQTILDEKGLVTAEDFETAVGVQGISQARSILASDADDDTLIRNLKKVSH